MEGVAAQQDMVLESRGISFGHGHKRVQPGVAGKYMIRLNEILYREFPVGLNIKSQTTTEPEGIQIVIADLFKYGCDVR